MSTQFEFMMQLYMMNLMQQQQQQQQQLQQKDILPMLTQLTAQTQQLTQAMPANSANVKIANAAAAAATTTTSTTTNTRTQNRNNSHLSNHQNNNNTNCSSSSSTSSPNSNFSHHLANNLILPQPQTPSNSSLHSSSSLSSSSTLSNLSLQQLLLFNNMPTIQQLMLQQQHQNTQSHSQSHSQSQQSLLLTPKSQLDNSQQLLSTSGDLLADYSQQGNALSNLSPFANLTNPATHTNFSDYTDFTHLTNNQFTAKHFLQSSTVTSTPTAKSPSCNQTANFQLALEQDEDISSVGDVGAFVIDDHEPHTHELEHEPAQQNAEQAHQHAHAPLKQQQCPTTTTTTKLTEAVETNDLVDELDSEQRLSSLYNSSSGIASSTSSGSCEMGNSVNSKLLLCSGVQALESTTDSYDSAQMYTPIKQPADSSYSQIEHSLGIYRETVTTRAATAPAVVTTTNPQRASPILTTTSEDITKTPQAIPQNILTPPSSEQSGNRIESQQSVMPTGMSTTGSLTTASALETFLQNEENLRNLKKVSSYLECDNPLCRQENLREHFHCYDEPCKGKILSKKDDIIRHLKWHKKRKESLLLGFARFSSSDDCAPEYGAGCAYNWKQTHYHCIYEDCPKVYVSTSDVQMHANFHRKNSEIVQEGFRRFRAHENCKIEDCPFYGKKISHYHCCREGCNHTFKNKADMDKHKTYHLKDYQLTQDGFKKILKTEVCPFDDCKFSTVCNHIHCVRENCNYILHSSTQMISHKRKHDRQDGEQAYQTYKKDKDMSEDESSPPTEMQTAATTALSAQQQTSTPLSSLTAEQFLSRKRGRPPKKIQLPADVAESKRIKLEQNSDQTAANNTTTTTNIMPSLYPPYIPNFSNNAAAVAAAAAAANTTQDTNAPNFQLTHLMALFQLQNPLFYQNLYPGGMANILGGTANALPAAPTGNFLGNLAAFNNAAAAAAAAAACASTNATLPHIKTELQEQQQQQQYKE